MSYYAAFLDLTDRPCLVVGGDSIAADKAEGLLQAGAQVTVLAAAPCAELRRLPVQLLRRGYRPGDLRGFWLAIDCEATRGLAEEAARERVLLNTVDQPAACDFIAPALVRRGPLQIAVSTSGESPFLAAAVKNMIDRLLGSEWGAFTALMGELRRELRRQGAPRQAQLDAFRRLLASNARELLARGDHAGAQEIVASLARRFRHRAA